LPCRLKTDASLREQNKSGDALDEECWLPAELVSPVLRGREGLVEVARLLTALNTLPVEVNRTTGLHVHVSAWHASYIMAPVLPLHFIAQHSTKGLQLSRLSAVHDALRYNTVTVALQTLGHASATLSLS
jgi:hypothetical protein